MSRRYRGLNRTMPKIVDPKKLDQANTHYPWDEWADGQTREYVMGEDFHTTCRDFIRIARRAAWARDMKVKASRQQDTVLLRFVPKNQNPDEDSET